MAGNRRTRQHVCFWSVLAIAAAAMTVPRLSFAQSVQPPVVWNLKSVDDGGPAGDVAYDTSIARDVNNNVHISYMQIDEDRGTLKYATDASGTFQVFTVDQTGDVGDQSSIAVQTDGTVHISYYDNANRHLKYAVGTPGAFTITTVDRGNDGADTPADVGQCSSLAVDNRGHVHISYYDATNGALKYAAGPPAEIMVQPLIDGGTPLINDVGRYTSLALDSLGNVHISYRDVTNGSLKYAHNAGGGAFNVLTVDDGGGTNDVGDLGTSIALDSKGRVHISYYDASDQVLKYATAAMTQGPFETQNLDTTGGCDVGAFSSLAIDSKDGAHISYQDFDNGAVKYISKPSGGVFGDPVVVDHTAYPGFPQLASYSDIAIDAGDHVHISYRDESRGPSNGILKHANSVKNGKADFNGNGFSEVAWRNAVNGAMVFWFMNGGVIDSMGFPPPVPDLNWRIVGFGDFNGDGKTDVLWRNFATGDVLMWIMNGSVMNSFIFLPTVADLNWVVQGVGDLNGDGMADVVWRNTMTGLVAIWTMNGTGTPVISISLAVADPNWRIEGIGDVNGDNRADLVWKNAVSGLVVVWRMNGNTVQSIDHLFAVADPNWRIAGIGDLNADNKSDIVWRNAATGQIVVWLMNGGGVAAIDTVFTVSDLNWKIEGIGDLNADNKSDIVWKNTATGQVAVWLMNGTAVTSIQLPLRVPDLNWRIVN